MPAYYLHQAFAKTKTGPYNVKSYVKNAKDLQALVEGFHGRWKTTKDAPSAHLTECKKARVKLAAMAAPKAKAQMQKARVSSLAARKAKKVANTISYETTDGA